MDPSLLALRTEIQNAEPVLARLDVEMQRIDFDPLVAASVAAASARVERVIEELLWGFDSNPILGPLARALRLQYLEVIELRVLQARVKLASGQAAM